MTASHRDFPHNEDHLSAATHYALLNALTTIRGQAQMVERWVRRNDVPDADAALERLRSIDRMVSRMVEDLDASRAAPEPGDGPTNGAGPT